MERVQVAPCSSSEKSVYYAKLPSELLQYLSNRKAINNISIKFEKNAQNVFSVNDRVYPFQSNEDNDSRNHDCYQEDHSQWNKIGQVKRKLFFLQQLSENDRDRIKKRTEEAEAARKDHISVVLDLDSKDLGSKGKKVKKTTVVSRTTKKKPHYVQVDNTPAQPLVARNPVVPPSPVVLPIQDVPEKLTEAQLRQEIIQLLALERRTTNQVNLKFKNNPSVKSSEIIAILNEVAEFNQKKKDWVLKELCYGEVTLDWEGYSDFDRKRVAELLKKNDPLISATSQSNEYIPPAPKHDATPKHDSVSKADLKHDAASKYESVPKHESTPKHDAVSSTPKTDFVSKHAFANDDVTTRSKDASSGPAAAAAAPKADEGSNLKVRIPVPKVKASKKEGKASVTPMDLSKSKEEPAAVAATPKRVPMGLSSMEDASKNPSPPKYQRVESPTKKEEPGKKEDKNNSPLQKSPIAMNDKSLPSSRVGSPGSVVTSPLSTVVSAPVLTPVMPVTPAAPVLTPVINGSDAVKSENMEEEKKQKEREQLQIRIPLGKIKNILNKRKAPVALASSSELASTSESSEPGPPSKVQKTSPTSIEKKSDNTDSIVPASSSTSVKVKLNRQPRKDSFDQALRKSKQEFESGYVEYLRQRSEIESVQTIFRQLGDDWTTGNPQQRDDMSPKITSMFQEHYEKTQALRSRHSKLRRELSELKQHIIKSEATLES